MAKESSVPIKTSALMALRTGALFFLILAILNACANTKTVKIPQEYIGAESTIVIVPIETGYKHAHLERLNIEAMIDEITKSPDHDLKESVLADLTNWHPETLLGEKIAEELSRRGKTVVRENEIVPLPDNIRGSSAAGVKWYNPDITIFDYSGIENRYHPTAIMEVSFESVIVFVHGNLTGILVRVIDPHTNKAIARIRTVQRLRRGNYNLRDPIQRGKYVLNFRADFENELAKALPKILDGVGF